MWPRIPDNLRNTLVNALNEIGEFVQNNDFNIEPHHQDKISICLGCGKLFPQPKRLGDSIPGLCLCGYCWEKHQQNNDFPLDKA